jgi:hypothetical protein
MRCLPLVIGAVAAAFASGASAQSVNLTGTYRCIQTCSDGYRGAPAFVTQNGDQVNLVTETGVSYRAWPDLTECGFSSTTAGSGNEISGLHRGPLPGGERRPSG